MWCEIEDAIGNTTRRVIIHDLHQARAALSAAAETGRPVVLCSAPNAAAYLGSGVFKALLDEARAAQPAAMFNAVLDCGEAVGHALGALRIGVPGVKLRASADVLARVDDIARQHGGFLDRSEAEALDLLDLADPEAACRAWLSGETSGPGRR